MNDHLKENIPPPPFKGIYPYEYSDSNIFFLRNEERRYLSRLIVMYRGVLLYSASGIGKSSLINAGLITDSINEGFNPEILRVQPVLGEEIIINQIEMYKGSRKYLPSIFPSRQEDKQIALSTENFKEIIYQNAVQFHPLLIFDQFEEWVTLFTQSSNGISKEKIFNTIISIIKDSTLSAKILLVFREDYLAEFTPFFKSCPNLVDQYLRLSPISANKVINIIRGPFENSNQNYSAEINNELAVNIQEQFVERSHDGNIQLTEVQIVAEGLYNAEADNKNARDIFNKFGIKGLIEQYFTKFLEELSIDEQNIAVALLSRMVTSSGTRNIISKENLLNLVEVQEGINKNLLEATLDKLEKKTPLIKRERRNQVDYYEIASEFLIGWIQNKAKEHELEKQQKKKKKLFFKKVKIVSEIVVIFILIAAIIIYFVQGIREKRLSSARELAVLSNSYISNDPEKSILWALEAMLTTYEADGILAPQAEDAMHKALQASRIKLTIKQNAPIRKAEFNSDGTRIATLTNDNIIRIWDSNSGKLENELSKNKYIDFSFNPKGEQLALCSDDTVKIWNTLSDSFESKPLCDTSKIMFVKYSMTGKYILTIDNYNITTIWDSKNRKIFRKFYSRNKLFMLKAAFNMNDSLLAESDSYGSIHIYEVKSGKILKEWRGHTQEIYTIAFNPREDVLASGSRDMTVKLWNCKNLSYDPYSDYTSYYYSLFTFNHPNTIFSVAFGNDGNTLISGGADRTAKVFNYYSKTELFSLCGHTGYINSCEFCSDGTRILTAGEDSTVKIWSAEPGKDYITLSGKSIYSLRDLEFSTDSNHLAAATDNNVIIWNAKSGYYENQSPTNYYINSIDFNKDGSQIAIGDSYGKALIWNPKTDSIKYLNGHTKSIGCISFNPQGKIIAASSLDSTVILWNLEGKIINVIGGYKSEIRTIAFNPINNSQLAIATYDSVVVIDYSLNKKVKQLFTLNNSAEINSIAYSPDGKIIAAGGSTGIVGLWDATDGKELTRLVGHNGIILDIVFSHDGSKLATASFDLTAKIWDLTNYRELLTLTGASSRVRSVSFSMDDSKIAVGSEDGLIRIFSLNTNDLIIQAIHRVSGSLNLNDYKNALNKDELPKSIKAINLYVKGKNAAMQGDSVRAIKIFRRVKSIDRIAFNYDPQKEATNIYIETLTEKGNALFKYGKFDQATVIFTKIRKLNPQYRIDRKYLQNTLEEGVDFVMNGKVEDAINIFNWVQKIDSTYEISADYWNDLCWYGLIWGEGENKMILEAGKKAVELDSSNVNYKDTRGVVRALNHDYQGAINDFETFVNRTTDNSKKERRIKWIKDLRAGKNPFNKDEFLELRSADLFFNYKMEKQIQLNSSRMTIK